MSDWVTHEIIYRETGLKETKLRGMVQRKVLQQGYEWALIDGKRMYNLQAIRSWLSTQASDQKAMALKYAGKSEGKNTRSTLMKRQRRQGLKMQLDTVRAS